MHFARGMLAGTTIPHVSSSPDVVSRMSRCYSHEFPVLYGVLLTLFERKRGCDGGTWMLMMLNLASTLVMRNRRFERLCSMIIYCLSTNMIPKWCLSLKSHTQCCQVLGKSLLEYPLEFFGPKNIISIKQCSSVTRPNLIQVLLFK